MKLYWQFNFLKTVAPKMEVAYCYLHFIGKLLDE